MENENQIENYKIQIRTHAITDDEKIRLGIFISHSSKDKSRLEEIENAINSMKLQSGLVAEKFIKTGKDFHEEIKKNLHCHAGVVILTQRALDSNWVSYECGYLDGLEKPIIIWDPDDVMSHKKLNNSFLNVHLLHHMPSVKTVEEVTERLKSISIYSSMYKHVANSFSREDFDKMLNEKVDTAIVEISFDEDDTKRARRFERSKELFERCTLSTLIVNFGMFYNNQKVENCNKLENGICKISKKHCAMISSPEADKGKIPSCIILNHVLPSGKFVDSYTNDKGITFPAKLQFFLPVHMDYGTEFKFIIDAPNPAVHKEMLELCDELGFHPTVSDSMDNLRIYLSLDKNESEGFFKIEDGRYNNNFLCPLATEQER